MEASEMHTFRKFCARWTAAASRSGSLPSSRRSSRPLRLEPLEDRVVPATVFDPNLGVREVVTGLTTPATMAFLGDNDFFVTEKNTGQVKRVVNGVVQSTVLDLPVNFASERGLLGMALAPEFPANPGVYLYWTESSTGADTNVISNVPLLGNRVDRFVWNGTNLTFDKNLIRLRARQIDAGQPERGNHDGGVIRVDSEGKVYIIVGDLGRRGLMQNITRGFGPFARDDQFGGPEPDNTHLSGVLLRLNPDGSAPSGNPFTEVSAVAVAPLLGSSERPNPVPTPATGFMTILFNPAQDFLTATFSFAGLTTPTTPGGAHIHVGGPEEAGPIIFPVSDFPGGITSGQFTTFFSESNFVPRPERGINTFRDAIDAILGGNTYFNIHTTMFPGGEIRGQLLPSEQAKNNIHKIWAYGIRNSFGFAFDPFSGEIWESENADDAYDEINRVQFGQNGGWIQAMGPVSRVADFKQIETTMFGGNLQQVRWPPTNIANTPQEALDRMFMIPSAFYSDPEFSWRFAVPPAGVGFMSTPNLGPEYFGDFFVGAATPITVGGYLLRFRFNADRTDFVFTNPGLADKVEDNTAKNQINESAELLFGRDFGVGTDIQTGPNGNLYVVSLSLGRVFEIFRKGPAGGATVTPDDNVDDDLGALLDAVRSTPASIAPAIQPPPEQSPPLDLPGIDRYFASLESEDDALLEPVFGASAPADDEGLGEVELFEPPGPEL
jgi:glucose/arabinose dehydrogenase